jgi:hypothetical protein
MKKIGLTIKGKTISNVINFTLSVILMTIIGTFCVEEKSFLAKWWVSLSSIGLTTVIMLIIAFIFGNFGIAGKIAFKAAWWAWGLLTGVGGGAVLGLSLEMVFHPEDYNWNIPLILIATAYTISAGVLMKEKFKNFNIKI